MPHVKLPSSHQNLELYYEVHGTGKTKILFIMGLLTDGAAWNRQTEFFAQIPEYQCVSFDNRGVGRSSAPLTIHYSTSQMAKDALALISHLQWPQCHVVGVSMGGMIALELAVLAPEKFLSLTLLATHAGGLSGQAPLIGVRQILQSIFIRDEQSLMENALTMLYSAKTLADPARRKLFYDYHMERFRKRVPISLVAVVGQLLATLRHFVSHADLLKIRYSPFECLIMVGSEDRLVREKNSYILQRVLGCRLIKLDDAGHGLQGEYADEVNKELFNFFESARKKEQSGRAIPAEYPTEIKALEQCCQHRTHCFVHDLIGFFKGICFGSIVYTLLSLLSLANIPFGFLHLSFRTVLLFGCLNGIRRSLHCIAHAFGARRFVHEHRLQLARASHHGGIGVSLPEEERSGIPSGCGFEFPILPLIVFANLLALIYWMPLSAPKI